MAWKIVSMSSIAWFCRFSFGYIFKGGLVISPTCFTTWFRIWHVSLPNTSSRSQNLEISSLHKNRSFITFLFIRDTEIRESMNQQLALTELALELLRIFNELSPLFGGTCQTLAISAIVLHFAISELTKHFFICKISFTNHFKALNLSWGR